MKQNLKPTLNPTPAMNMNPIKPCADDSQSINPVGRRFIMIPQGSSCLATLGCVRESRWDSSSDSTRKNKVQIPNTKFQRSSRRQIATRTDGKLELGAWSLVFIWCLVFGSWSFSAKAELPEPDNIIYGVITRGGVPVSAADTDVVVEAHRTSDGAVVASYRMGDSPRSGNNYTLRVPLEVFTPINDPLASLTGTSLTIAVSDFNGVFAEVPFTIGGRGQFQQLNISQIAGSDSDGDGLLDAWELAVFGNLLQSTITDRDGDGVTDGAEYLAGTDPNDPNDRFRLTIQRMLTGEDLTFVARAASGAGTGKVRRYTLESTTNLAAPNWAPVNGYVNVAGAGQTVHYPVPPQGPNMVFYRVLITLGAP
jgi:hypothetical protein